MILEETLDLIMCLLLLKRPLIQENLWLSQQQEVQLQLIRLNREALKCNNNDGFMNYDDDLRRFLNVSIFQENSNTTIINKQEKKII